MYMEITEKITPMLSAQSFPDIAVSINRIFKDELIFSSLLLLIFLAVGAVLFIIYKKKSVSRMEQERMELSSRSSDEIRRSELKFKTLFNSTNDYIFILDTKGRFVDVNDMTCERLGYTRDELSKMTVRDIDPPEYAEQVPERLRALKEKGQAVFESAHITKDKRIVPVEISARVIEYNGAPAFLSVIRDITDRKRAEKELRERSEIIDSIGRATHDAIIMIDDNKISYWNSAAENIFGYTREEAIGGDIYELIIPKKYRMGHEKAFKDFQKNGYGDIANKVMELSAIKKNGIEFPIELSLSAVKINNKMTAISTIRDITEQKRAEEERRKDYLNLVGIIIVATDVEGIVTFINNAGCKMLGYEKNEILGESWLEKFVPEKLRIEAKKNYHAIKSESIGYVQNFESLIINKDRQERTIIWNNTLLRDSAGNVTGTISAGEDITDKKQIEKEKEELWQQLLHSQKMESLGRITGGLAHDFNNILTAIIGYSQLAMTELKDNPVVSKIKIIRKSADKAANLIHHLLAFSRKEVLELRPSNLNSIVKDMAKIFTRVIGEDIDLNLQIDTPVKNIMADGTHIEQALMNMVVNARYAMPNGGELIIETKDVTLDKKFVRKNPGAKEGRYVMLSVKDTGCGMTPEVKERIFEPFFTTREKGEGTGLGLSTVFGIVKQHNGTVANKNK